MTAVASYSALPEPMLARSGRLPTSGDYAYEVKWGGFRAIVSTTLDYPRLSATSEKANAGHRMQFGA